MTSDSDETFAMTYRIGEDIDPADYVELWHLVSENVAPIFAAKSDVAQIRFEFSEAVNGSGIDYPASSRFRYFNKDSEELNVGVLCSIETLSKSAWLFEQSFLETLETFVHTVSLQSPKPNAVWNVVFLPETAFLATPNIDPAPTIHFLTRERPNGHDRLAEIDAARALFETLNGTSGDCARRRPTIVSAAEHDRRVTELINYASEQVTRRRALANAIRGLIDTKSVPADRIDDLEAVLAKNGPI